MPTKHGWLYAVANAKVDADSRNYQKACDMQINKHNLVYMSKNKLSL